MSIALKTFGWQPYQPRNAGMFKQSSQASGLSDFSTISGAGSNSAQIANAINNATFRGKDGKFYPIGYHLGRDNAYHAPGEFYGKDGKYHPQGAFVGKDGLYHPSGSFIGIDKKYHLPGSFLGTDGQYHVAGTRRDPNGTYPIRGGIDPVSGTYVSKEAQAVLVQIEKDGAQA